MPHLLSEEKPRLGKIRLLADSAQGNFICAFLNKESNKCKVYQLRPFECQLYPFVFNRQDNKVFFAADLKCPYLKDNFKSPEFKEYAQHLIAMIKSPSFLNILKANPELVQSYPGVVALAALEL